MLSGLPNAIRSDPRLLSAPPRRSALAGAVPVSWVAHALRTTASCRCSCRSPGRTLTSTPQLPPSCSGTLCCSEAGRWPGWRELTARHLATEPRWEHRRSGAGSGGRSERGYEARQGANIIGLTQIPGDCRCFLLQPNVTSLRGEADIGRAGVVTSTSCIESVDRRQGGIVARTAVVAVDQELRSAIGGGLGQGRSGPCGEDEDRGGEADDGASQHGGDLPAPTPHSPIGADGASHS